MGKQPPREGFDLPNRKGISPLKFDTLINRFIRGAAFSRQEEALFLIEANHSIYMLQATPLNKAQFLSLRGCENLEQSNLVNILANEPVKHSDVVKDKTVTYCTRKYSIFTSLGTVDIIVTSDDADDADVLELKLQEQAGYPPEDAKRITDFNCD